MNYYLQGFSMIRTATVTLFLFGTLAHASTLSVYQDQTIYEYTPTNSFIGVTQNISAKCDGETVPLQLSVQCPDEQRLCKDLEKVNEAEKIFNALEINSRVLDQFLTLPQPTAIDAQSWITSAKLIGDEKAKLAEEKTRAAKTLRLAETRFNKQAPAKETLSNVPVCTKVLSLTLPYGYITFSSSYEADILNEKEVKVTQYISIVNRSGIDIEVEKAMFYYKSANQHVRAVSFTPWIISKYEPRSLRKKMKRSAPANGMQDEAPLMALSMASPSPQVRPHAMYVDAREYQINDLNLPSTGESVDVEVTSWKRAVKCELKVYPYLNSKAFQLCTFQPEHQIDSHRWKIKKDGSMINERGVGLYRKNSYVLYTEFDDDINIVRKPMVNKERETGIFGGTVRKKDGFTLELTNKSEKKKKLTVIERIPTSTTDEIKVKLLKIKAENKVDYKILKDGQVEIVVLLNAKESKKIEIVFEITYDKDLKVRY